MSGKKVLVIDDSATIRRLVDSGLSPEGYQVLLAATAEEGLRMALDGRPDVILLDHQLPGTTGFEVCRQLLAAPATQQIPVVVSSTLRKRAYAEYTDFSNVVDLLPKPYTVELLKTTIANALDTGALVVTSQERGTAVPEVIHELAEPELSGTFRHFGPREVLDFLNNGGKSGVLEIVHQRRRTYFHLERGRIAAVTATGLARGALADRLPPAMKTLSPVLDLTLAGRPSGQLDSIVELLDRKVLDPRLMRRLLLTQAALLTFDCFTDQLTDFRFQSGHAAASLHSKLPLDISLAALLIEGAMLCDASALPDQERESLYMRRVLRGQNLDRAGVSAQQMKLLSLLAEPHTADQLALTLGWSAEETARVLYGLLLAEVIERCSPNRTRVVVAFESEPVAAERLREALEATRGRYLGKVVKDRLALQLVLKRTRPDAILFGLDGGESEALCREVYFAGQEPLRRAGWVALVPPGHPLTAAAGRPLRAEIPWNAVLVRPCPAEQLIQALDKVLDRDTTPANAAPPGTPLASRPASLESTNPIRREQHDAQPCATEV